MSVQTTYLPTISQLHSYIANGDFVDCYSCPSYLHVEQVAMIAMEMPSWARILMTIRNAIVGPFGLKTRAPMGDKIGEFPVLSRDDRELILGFDDKHLDFRISILRDSNLAYGATWVRTNNWFGKLYLATIMPFHVMIMRNAMARVAKAHSDSDKSYDA